MFGEKRKLVSGEEFIKRVLAGDRNFPRTELQDNYNLTCNGDLEKYLKENARDLYNRPIILEHSKLKGVNASGLHLPQLRANEARLEEANLSGAYLFEAYLRGADLEGADLTRVNFMRADLRGVKNLENAQGLGTAYFYETKVTPEEKAIIEEALKKEKILVVE